ncbi:c-type cytochrome [Massilia norwichensis]|uniref:C-type cytochrome n=1 Tax=Massilia norwichensis TaxID=1442366 RepID=A0ABT2A1I3_9BURK|nr:c-type cytochrome [Massilia norwichensis]MCS0588056.1 c-type cytochrome [Massilia norwichensis]
MPILSDPLRQTVRAALVAGLSAALCMALLAGCGGKPKEKQVPGGDAKLGKQLVTQYQCGACHKISDVRGAAGEVGPSLDGFGKLSYIATIIPNQPDQLIAWLVNPPAMKPGTAMPAMGLTEQEARHMAAYLYTLRSPK